MHLTPYSKNKNSYEVCSFAKHRTVFSQGISTAYYIKEASYRNALLAEAGNGGTDYLSPAL